MAKAKARVIGVHGNPDSQVAEINGMRVDVAELAAIGQLGAETVDAFMAAVSKASNEHNMTPSGAVAALCGAVEAIVDHFAEAGRELESVVKFATALLETAKARAQMEAAEEGGAPPDGGEYMN